MRLRIQFSATLLFIVFLCKVGMGAKDDNKSEPYNYFRDYVGLNAGQIQSISSGKALAKVLDTGSADQILVFGAVHIDSTPQKYLKFASDIDALRKLPFGQTWATVLTILLSWGYAFLADLGSPIVRATITLCIYLVTRLLFRDRAALNALGIAALGILLVNPRTVFEASFQLTFLSVIAVAGIAVPVLRRTLYPLQNGLRNIDSPEYDFSAPTRAAETSCAATGLSI